MIVRMDVRMLHLLKYRSSHLFFVFWWDCLNLFQVFNHWQQLPILFTFTFSVNEGSISSQYKYFHALCYIFIMPFKKIYKVNVYKLCRFHLNKYSVSQPFRVRGITKFRWQSLVVLWSDSSFIRSCLGVALPFWLHHETLYMSTPTNINHALTLPPKAQIHGVTFHYF